MDIVLCYKLSPDTQDIQVNRDRSLSFEHSEWIIGDFDLAATEAAAQLAEKTGSRLRGVSVGTTQLAGSRSRKNMLSRGLDELVLVQDDSFLNADSHKTAGILAGVIGKIGPCDLVICGEGSSDLYFQQVGLQLGQMMGVPVINAVSKLVEVKDGVLIAERTTENSIDTLEIPLPAVICVTADICQSRIPKMQEIIKAGKKPVTEISLSELSCGDAPSEIVSILAPLSAERKHIRIEGSVAEMAGAILSSLGKDGLI